MKIEIKKYVDSITRYAAALAVAVYSLALTQSVHAQASPSIEKKSLKILGIGNSFLKNATNMLPGIVKDSGHELYDLSIDVSEQNDLSAAKPKKTDHLKSVLLRYLDSVDARRAKRSE
jgi:hypothetical protein